jgi:hypothetical protein
MRQGEQALAAEAARPPSLLHPRVRNQGSHTTSDCVAPRDASEEYQRLVSYSVHAVCPSQRLGPSCSPLLPLSYMVCMLYSRKGLWHSQRRPPAQNHGLQQPAQDKPLAMYYCLIAPNPLRKAPCPPPYRLWCSPPVPSPTIQPLNSE